MSRTKEAIWDELEKQHRPWGQPSDVMASKQIEIDQQGKNHAENFRRVSGSTAGIWASSQDLDEPAF